MSMEADRNSTDTAAVQEIPHPTLYFAGGDIVVSATDAKEKMDHYFRVDKIMLARHSPVFKDMLQLGDGSAASNEHYDGVPLVHLTDDVRALAGLLGTLYNMAYVYVQLFLLRSRPDCLSVLDWYWFLWTPHRSLPLVRFHSDNPLNLWGITELAVKSEVVWGCHGACG